MLTLLTEGAHPNDAGYSKMAELWVSDPFFFCF